MFALCHLAIAAVLALPQGSIALRNPAANRCVAAAGDGTVNGTPLVLWDCTGVDSQAFVLHPVDRQDGTQYYNLVNVHAHRCVDVSRTSTSPGAVVWLWDCLGTAQRNQHWAVVDVQGNGQYRLQSRLSGLMLDVSGGNVAQGTPIQQWSDNGLWPQRWALASCDVSGADFVRLAPGGASLQLGGQPYYMLGFQMWYPAQSCGFSRQQMLDALDASKRAGANTVRLWFLQSHGGPNNWDSFDDTIAQLKARGLRAIITLVNQWGNCEARVNGAQHYLGLDWYQGGYRRANDGYPLAYRDYVRAVAAHYRDETAIAVYQLVNEAEARDMARNSCPDDRAAAQAIRAFADDMVEVIRSVDTHHLVNLGTQDNGYCGVQGDSYTYIHAGKVDLCEVHSYEPANEAMPNLSLDKVRRCQALGKPTFMGEVGICQNVQADASCKGPVTPQSLQRRASFFTQKAQANRSAGLCGFLLWDWQYFQGDAFGINLGEPLLTQMPGW
ncbi:MAG: hypothetical protein EOO40_04845 [Deltaproteobacteria bacterium]|nr:MAG: hypothetical protein EOO40_04845 [Deltaproteobacteria bacterium]